MLGRTAAQVDEVASRGVERARHTGLQAQDKWAHASDRTVSYIHEKPVKSVLAAAAAGVGIAYLAALITGSRRGAN